MTEIILDFDDITLERLQRLAAQQDVAVPDLIQNLVQNDVEKLTRDGMSSHDSCLDLLKERAAYYEKNPAWRQEIHDRAYARAQSYKENRDRLLMRIDNTKGDMGRQIWNREQLYDSRLLP